MKVSRPATVPDVDQAGVSAGRDDRCAAALPERLRGADIFLGRIWVTRFGRRVSAGFALVTGANEIRSPLAASSGFARRLIFDDRPVFKGTAFLSRAAGTAGGFAKRGNRKEAVLLAGGIALTTGNGASLLTGSGGSFLAGGIASTTGNGASLLTGSGGSFLAGGIASTTSDGASRTRGMGSTDGKSDSLGDGLVSAAGKATTAAGEVALAAGGVALAAGGVALRGSGVATGLGCSTVRFLPLSVALAFALA
ncbi:MAG: hypothetical protein J2P54_06645 [Bradyrhizobiaceae bacterium]|nr:hypothetical protein [Bradyrhizobiaceae bacterium]